MTDDENAASDVSMVMFTPEYLTLPGLYNEVIDDNDQDDDIGVEDDDSCYCDSCSTASPALMSSNQSSVHHLQIAYHFHKFISSLRVVPVFRNFQVSHPI